MELTTNVSKMMDKESLWNDGYEHKIARIPSLYRKECNLNVGDFLYFKDLNGSLKMLQVAEAFVEDVKKNKSCVYVSSKTGNELLIKNEDVNEVDKVTGITLGCDPEAFLVDILTNNIVSAGRFFRKSGEVGNDGLLIEFRPSPSSSADGVCANLWKLIQKARTVINSRPEGNRVAIVAASSYNGLTAGFHLHYGFPRGLLGYNSVINFVASLMTSVFDYYVGIPSILPEGNIDTNRRTVKFTNYGKPGGYRIDNRTFEFRMPGGINLCHPLLAKGLITLGSVVAEDVASRVNTCTDCFSNLKEMLCGNTITKLYPNLPNINDFFNIICNSEIDLAKKHFEIIKDDVRQMVGYNSKSDDVEQYFNFLDNDYEFGNNIEKNWGDFYAE